MHPDGLTAAKAKRIAGACVFCEEQVPPRRVQCGAPACTAAYYRAWHRDAAVKYPWRYHVKRKP